MAQVDRDESDEADEVGGPGDPGMGGFGKVCSSGGLASSDEPCRSKQSRRSSALRRPGDLEPDMPDIPENRGQPEKPVEPGWRDGWGVAREAMTLEDGAPAFALRAGEALNPGLRRSVAEQVGWGGVCLRELSGQWSQNADLAVHELRKVTKRLRALLQLVRGCVNAPARKSANSLLREISGDFSGVRDALVQYETLAALRAGMPGMSGCLNHDLDVSREAVDLQALAAGWLRRWDALAESLLKWDLDGALAAGGLEACLARNLRRTLKRARKAWRAALASGAGDAYHETRKPVKQLWYHACLLQVTDPRLWGRLEPVLDQWADALGSDHDFHVLQAKVEAKRDLLSSGEEWERILHESRSEQKKLRKRMREQADLVMRWKPKELERRVFERLKEWSKKRD